MQIYKILRADEWDALSTLGTTAGSPDDAADGYVHFSTADQVADTLRKHFDGQDGLVLLAMDADRLGESLRWEPARDGADFPHLYRALSLSDVIWNRPIAVQDGRHVLPDGVV